VIVFIAFEKGNCFDRHHMKTYRNSTVVIMLT